MAELKPPDASAVVADSQAPTIAPSRASLSEKESVPDDSAQRAHGQEPVQTEKQHDLAKQTTAASQAGHSLRTTPTRDDGSEYPTGVKLALISLALCLSVFLIALDNSIIATAIPKITDDFHSLPDVGWYGSAYLLTTAALQLLFGKFYSFFSVKWVYLVAIAIFELGSLVCAVANNSVALIVGRAIAGVGSAGIFSGALIILAHSVPLEKRPAYSGGIGSMYGIASVSGPLLGGVFTDKVTWRWCFYINLPIGAITILVIALFFPPPTRTIKPTTFKQKLGQFDPVGTAVFMPAIVCLLLALQWGGTTYAWGEWRIILLLVLFALLIAAFLFVQWKRQEMATVPPRIFFKRSVWSSSLYSFCVGAAFLGSVYYLPIWFQAVQGASAVDSGIRNLPMLISTVLLSLIAGIIVTIIGYYTPFMIFGAVLTAIGYGLLSTFRPDTERPVWIGYQILAGAGVGMGMQQPLMAVQTVLGIEDVPIGTSVVIFMQTLGGALFVSVGQNVFTNKLVEYVHQFAPGVNPSDVLANGATSIRTIFPPDVLPGIIQAYNDALDKTFIIFAAMAAIGVLGAAIVEFKSVKGKKIEMAAA